MPKKQTMNRKSKRKQLGPAANKQRRPDTWIVPRNNPNFIPRRVIANFRQLMQCSYATALAQPNGILSIQPSSFFQPFNQVTIPVGSTGASKSNMSITGGFNINDSALGYNEMANLYSYFKVMSARLKVRVGCANTFDLVTISGAPSIAQITSFTDQLPMQAYGKASMATNAVMGEINFSSSSNDILGYSKTQFEGLAPTLLVNGPSGTQQWFFNIQWQTYNNAAPSGPLSFEFILEQTVEISEPGFFSA